MPGILPRSARRIMPAIALVAWGATVCQAGAWVLPDSQIGRKTAPLLLMSRPEIQAELKLAPETVRRLDAAIADIHAKAYALRGRRDAEAVAARRAIDDAQREWLDANLTEEQRTRLAQLDLQWEGPAALHSRGHVADMLRLNETQKKQLATAHAAREAKRAAPGRDGLADDAALAQGALAVLNLDQQARWKAMLGAPCAFKVATAAPAAAAAPAAPKR